MCSVKQDKTECNKMNKYHTVGTVPISNRKIPHCRNSSVI
jgi:hypothetical protein